MASQCLVVTSLPPTPLLRSPVCLTKQGAKMYRGGGEENWRRHSAKEEEKIPCLKPLPSHLFSFVGRSAFSLYPYLSAPLLNFAHENSRGEGRRGWGKNPGANLDKYARIAH